MAGRWRHIAAALLVLVALSTGTADAAKKKAGGKNKGPKAPPPAVLPYDKLAGFVAAADKTQVLNSLAAAIPKLSQLLSDSSFEGTAFLIADQALTPMLAVVGGLSAVLASPQLLAMMESELLGIVPYHLVPGAALLTSAMKNNQVLVTALGGATLTLKNTGGLWWVQGASSRANIIAPDLLIKGGKIAIQLIDGLLYPPGWPGAPAAAPQPSSSPAPRGKSGTYASVLDFMANGGIVPALWAQLEPLLGPQLKQQLGDANAVFTMFIPLADAFSSNAVVVQLLKDSKDNGAALQRLLLNHMVQGKAYQWSDWVDGLKLQTEAGSELLVTVNSKGRVSVNNRQIFSGSPAGKAIVYPIDSVLVPAAAS